MPVAPLPGIELYFETFGSEEDPTLVLIAGLGSQSVNFPEELCLAFADRGVQVVRFDNRDCGLTAGPDGAGAYGLSDMAGDVVGLLDHLGVGRAHVWGSSMGGMIAQVLAIEHPERVASLTSVQSATGEAEFARPDPPAMAALLEVARPAVDRSDAIALWVHMTRVLTNNDEIFDEERQTAKAEQFYDRAYRPDGVERQLTAILTAPPRTAELAALDVPTLVIHGTRDPLIGVAGAERLVELIAGARLALIDGMGHDLTARFWSQYVDLTIAHIAAAERSPT